MRTFRPSFPTRLKKLASAPTARRRRHSPFDPDGVHGVTATKVFRASVRPPPQLRTPLFARHSRRFPTQTELPGVLKGLNFSAHARQNRVEILES